ncbi:MAG: ABC transporter substrate-binding protein [Deltaproteobacteria bacterium]|nr:ABC transporter substrate-binding protein [Deltaproteobacteria bacterium]TLN01633.1 MAG: ABC transporter substrate-binding protein [bacterium]
MNYIVLIIPFLTLVLLASPASAWDVLVVQKYRAKPYADVVRGFDSVDSGKTSVLILEELSEEDPVREIRRRNPDLILAIGADALAKVSKIGSIPIIYCMVLNPEPLAGNEDNITGISMSVSPEKQLATLRKNLPGLKKIGTVYNPAKMSSFLEKARFAGQKIGVQLVGAKADRPQDVPRALESLPRDLDAFWMLPDSTVTSPEVVEATILYSIRTKTPVFTFSDKYLRIGAAISLELNTFELGKQAAEMAKKIRSGTAIKNIPRAFAEQATLSFNHAVAAKFEIPLN